MQKLVVVILAFNEASNIERCISTFNRKLPIVVVDSGSTDGTREMAASMGCEVLESPWAGFAAQRNYAMTSLSRRFLWVLFVDADEVFPPEIFAWIDQNISDAEFDVAYFSQRIVLNGRKLNFAPHYPIFHPRLVSTSTGRQIFLPNASGHGETVLADARSVFIDIPYIHYSINRDIGRWLAKHVELASRESAPLPAEKGAITSRARVSSLVGVGPLRPIARFLYHYIWSLGFLDGRAGFQYSLMYFWYELTKWIFKIHSRRPS